MEEKGTPDTSGRRGVLVGLGAGSVGTTLVLVLAMMGFSLAQVREDVEMLKWQWELNGPRVGDATRLEVEAARARLLATNTDQLVSGPQECSGAQARSSEGGTASGQSMSAQQWLSSAEQ